jgi:hypothetical protein
MEGGVRQGQRGGLRDGAWHVCHSVMDDPIDCVDRILVRRRLVGRAKEAADMKKAKPIR